MTVNWMKTGMKTKIRKMKTQKRQRKTIRTKCWIDCCWHWTKMIDWKQS